MKNYNNLYSAALLSASAVLFLILVSFTASAVSEQSGSPVKTYAYITNMGSNNVSVIDTATNTVIATVPVGRYPQELQ